MSEQLNVPDDLKELYQKARWNNAVIHYLPRHIPDPLYIPPSLQELIERIGKLEAENEQLEHTAKMLAEALERVSKNKWEPDKYHMALTEALSTARKDGLL